MSMAPPPYAQQPGDQQQQQFGFGQQQPPQPPPMQYMTPPLPQWLAPQLAGQPGMAPQLAPSPTTMPSQGAPQSPYAPSPQTPLGGPPTGMYPQQGQGQTNLRGVLGF